MGRTFFNPITLSILVFLELCVLIQSARYFQREESKLKNDLLGVLHPWQQQYGIVAKMRKTRGRFGDDGDGKKSSMHYCLVLDKMDPEHDDTASVSTFTEMVSDVESQT